jgi:hypothetical protein
MEINEIPPGRQLVDGYLINQLIDNANGLRAVVYSRQQNFGTKELEISGGVIEWDLSVAQAARITLTESATLQAPTNMVNGGTYALIVVQGAGAYTLSYDSAVYKFVGGIVPTISTGAGAIDLICWLSTGELMLGNASQDFS